MKDAYTIGLGNDDPHIRRDAAADYASFWEGQAGNLHWFRKWDVALDWKPPFARWFEGGLINASYNALDVHLKSRGTKPAIVWEGEDGSTRTMPYAQLHGMVCRMADALKSLGVGRGDRVLVYLPMVPELPVSMLACARIGAIHTVVFSGFSASSIRDRLKDSGAKVVITADGGFRRGKLVKLKEVVDEAIKGLSLEHVIVVRHAKNKVAMSNMDKLWDELSGQASPGCEAEQLPSEHPLYILYTSGTTGKPKGVLHGTGGYLTHLYATFGWAFDIRDTDVYFCTADIGWVTGHSYVVYGPLLRGATILMYEGAPDHPGPSRIWDMVERHNVTILYTTPTAIRMAMKHGDHIPESRDLSSLRLLGSVGEPINPEVWRWYHTTIGKGRCPVIDTWWQTETGGMLVSALPGIETVPLKPGSGTRAIPGVDIRIVDGSGNEVEPNTKGYLVVKNPWPGMMLTLWGDDQRYKETYWSKYEGCYYPGDYAMRDEDGYLWLLGRADDILKVAGHRIGTAELEGCLVSHQGVAEAAVCGVPDEVKGEAIIAFVVPKEGAKQAKLQGELAALVRGEVGAIAAPKEVHLVQALPKTRSGKIMRRLLRSMAAGGEQGDTSTLEDAGAVSGVREALGSGGRE